MATKTLLSTIHYGAVATYAPIKGLKNHLAIFVPLGNIQANNLTQYTAHAYQSMFSRHETFSAPLSPFHVTFSAMLSSSHETFSTVLSSSLSTVGLNQYGCISFRPAGGVAYSSNSELVDDDGSSVLLISASAVAIVVEVSWNAFMYTSLTVSSLFDVTLHHFVSYQHGEFQPIVSKFSRFFLAN